MRAAMVIWSLILLTGFTINDAAAEVRKKSRATFSDIHVTKKFDKASAQVQRTKASGAGAKQGNASVAVKKVPAAPPPQPIPYPNQAGADSNDHSSVVAKRKGGRKLKYMEYKMNDVMISRASGGSHRPRGPRAGLLEGGLGGFSTQVPAAAGVPTGAAAAPSGPMLR